MSRALLRRLEAIESVLAITKEPIVVSLDGQVIDAFDSSQPLPPLAARADGRVRMVQVAPDGREVVLEIGPRPAPARGGRGGKRRRRNGRGVPALGKPK